MIPYFGQTTVFLGPIPVQVWGTFVALGIIVALWVIIRRAKVLDLNKQLILDTAVWVIIGVIIGARLFHILFYDIQTYIADPMEILRVWHGGLSSIGGFVGGALAGIWKLRRANANVWKYADTMAFGVPIGIGVGRIGCFLIHDHPGTASDFFLSVQWPDGESRLDHGLLLSINGFLLALFFALLAKKKRPIGFYLAVFGVWYGVVRFILDFWRAADATYLGLTPAQYAAILMALLGGYWLHRLLSRDRRRATIDKH